MKIKNMYKKFIYNSCFNMFVDKICFSVHFINALSIYIIIKVYNKYKNTVKINTVELLVTCLSISKKICHLSSSQVLVHKQFLQNLHILLVHLLRH